MHSPRRDSCISSLACRADHKTNSGRKSLLTVRVLFFWLDKILWSSLCACPAVTGELVLVDTNAGIILSPTRHNKLRLMSSIRWEKVRSSGHVTRKTIKCQRSSTNSSACETHADHQSRPPCLKANVVLRLSQHVAIIGRHNTIGPGRTQQWWWWWIVGYDTTGTLQIDVNTHTHMCVCRCLWGQLEDGHC